MIAGYIERHHVVPRCLGGRDEPANLVRLTPEEHYVAHQLLAKMHPGHAGLLGATMSMAVRAGNKVYGWLRRSYSEKLKNRKLAAEHALKFSRAQLGKVRPQSFRDGVSRRLKGQRKSPEHVEKMRQQQTGKKASDATRQRMSASHRGHPVSAETRARISEVKRRNNAFRRSQIPT